MFINIFQIIFFNQYIISPKTYLHRIKYSYKITFTFLYLCLFYYFHYTYAIISIIICLIIITNLKVKQKQLIRQLKFIFLFTICLFQANKNIKNIKDIKLYFKIQIKIPYNMKIKKNLNLYRILFSKIKQISNQSYILLLPEFIIRAACIPAISLLLLNILFLTTTYEEIIIYLLIQIKKLTGQNISLIITTSSQLLLIINKKIYQIILGIKLRNITNNFSVTNIYLYYYSLIELLIFIQNNIQIISYILYIRNINDKNFVTLKL